MRVDILTLFPEMFEPFKHSIIKRAIEKELVEVNITNIRDFTHDKHNSADDRLYGGGAGMVMKPEPICEAVDFCKNENGNKENVRVVITSPAGQVFTQKVAEDLAKADQVIFICGHYEGIDARVEELVATDILSIGDYVLTGGEVPAMIMADSVMRLLPGVLGTDASSEEESFSDGLLEYPQFTRPEEFMGLKVPDVLMGGNHEEIRKWRREESLKRTVERRPELLSKAVLTNEDKQILDKLNLAKPKFRLWITLLHYPVYNKKSQVINTSITNLDIHDIARASATFGLSGYFIVQPQVGQKEMISKLISHWKSGFGANYNPDRNEALSRVSLMDSLEEVVAEIEKRTGNKPKLIGTSAKASSEMVSYSAMRREMAENGGDYLLVLGTGYGLVNEILDSCDFVLRPVYGVGAYNHLSVRSAASIMMDRLMGEKE